MGKLKFLFLGLAVVIVLGIGGFGLYSVLHKEEPDPKLEPSGVTVNDEELNIYGKEAYEYTLQYMFPDSGEAESLLFADGHTVLYENHIPIVLKPVPEEKEYPPTAIGVYDFEKSLQRRFIEQQYDTYYTGDLVGDVEKVLTLFTGIEKRGKKEEPDLDPSDAPTIEGLNNFITANPSAIAITDSVEFKKGKLDIKFHTVDVSDPDGSKQAEAEENDETWISSSGYNESAAAYTYCEECIGYILMFPEYVEQIDEISIKGENFAPMHYNKDTLTCKYAMTEGKLYETWNGYLVEGDEVAEGDTVYIPLEVLDPAEAEKRAKEEEMRSASYSLTDESDEKPAETSKPSPSTGAGITLAIIIPIIISIIICLVMIIGMWKVYAKTGLPGWISLVPILNAWALFEMTWGSGIKMLFCFIPIYGIVVIIQTMFKLAKVFGKGTLFGLGLTFLSPIFICILGFSDAEYLGVDE